MQPKVVSQDPMTQLQNLISGELGLNFNDGLMGYGMEFGGPPPPKTHLGLASCNLLKDYVRTYPYLKEVAVLLKRFLAENNLNQSYLGKFIFLSDFYYRRNKLLQRCAFDSCVHE